MLNTVTVMGRLTRDPELRRTTTGRDVCTIRLAVDRNGKDAPADFFDVVAWNHTAKFVSKYFRKGKPILISGRLASRTWEDKDGKKRVSVEIIAENVYFCGGDRAAASAESVDATFTDVDAFDDGGMPFDMDEELPL